MHLVCTGGYLLLSVAGVVPINFREERVLVLYGSVADMSFYDEAAAEFILETADADETIVIGTDSQSLCTALLSANRETDRI